jgi:single-stranded-DNA-specific exonuclease
MNWEKKNVAPELVKDISTKYGCDLLTASILARRGVVDGENICYFLEDDPRHLRNAYELPGMEDAVERILGAKEEGEKVLVFGDRDVDGITSTTLVTSFLKKIGVDVEWQLPVGDDFYGLSVEAVEKFAANYGTLIITVDCGISNHKEIDKANEFGIDVIVIDHHNQQETLPAAFTIVNPKLDDSKYPFRDLAGCGVAYKVVSALRFALKSEMFNQPICLFDTRPSNDAFIIEAVKIRNLVVTQRITENIVPGMVSLDQTRLASFLEGQQILVWDALQQKKNIAKMFGTGVEIYTLDIASEIGKEIPAIAGKSLLRIKELSKIAKYSNKTLSEMDVFINLFTSFVHRKEKLFDEDDLQDLQLAMLGTLADIMPLKDENRIIVRTGLASLMKKPRAGIQDLLFKLGCAGRRIAASDISWTLCPAINATGRMGKPDKAAALLLSEDAKERDRLADEVIAMNEERKKLGNDTWLIAEPLASKSFSEYNEKLVLAASDKIPRGVTGIMANKLINLFKVPALVITMGGETIVGSLRSVRGYDLRGILEQLADLFIDWGGHAFAAGFSMKASNWNDFLSRLKTAVHTIELENNDEENISIDAELPHSYMTPDIFNLIDKLEPYGALNEPLTFMARNLKVKDINLMGKTEAVHVKLTLDCGKHHWPAIYWQAAEKVTRDFDLNDNVDVVFQLNRNWYNGTETPQIMVKDLRRSE